MDFSTFFSPHFLAVLLVAVISEILPFVKSMKADGILQALWMLIKNIADTPQDTAALEARIAQLENEIKTRKEQ